MLRYLNRLRQSTVQAGLASWQRLPLPLQGKILTILPFTAILISFALALHGNYQRSQLESAFQRHIQMVHDLDSLVTLMVNAETGMRGYLLTGSEEFLEPYTTATNNLPTTLADLKQLVATEPGEEPRASKSALIEQLQTSIAQQMSDLAWQRTQMDASRTPPAGVEEHLRYGKQLMDSIRTNAGAMEQEEETLLNDRIEEMNAVRQRDYLAVFLTLIVGFGSRLLAWHLFETGIVGRIRRLRENAVALRDNALLPHLPSGKADELGTLEREIMHTSEHLRNTVSPKVPLAP